MATAPGAPDSQVSPGAKIPPKASPNTQTTSPHAALDSPASRDDQPVAAAISHTPSPAWIHTADAAACTGWYDHMVPPKLTTCWTQPGEAPATGAMTCDGKPPAIFGCACRIASKIHNRPNAMRRNFRDLGSAAGAGRSPAGHRC